MIDKKLAEIWLEKIQEGQHFTFLTGAGVSAESGIPTFRGSEGYWTVGSKEYYPEEMATRAMFKRHPFEVWKWYLYRRAVCAAADPNPAHLAISDIEKLLGNNFTLITQNVDGLHLRAGNSLENTFQIHGNINYMRCAEECGPDLYPVPENIPARPIKKDFSDEELGFLRCPKCGKLSRPHVLWFDEFYDDKFFRFRDSLEIAASTDVLVTAGSSGATTLPNHIVQTVVDKGGLVVDINPEFNPFAQSAMDSGGYFLSGPGGEILLELLKIARSI